MKDTLRKRSTKTGSGSEFDVTPQLDVTSQSSDSVSPNPWASEASSTLNDDPISRQVSKVSKDATSPILNVVSPPATDAKDQSQSPPPSAPRLEVPTADNGPDDPAKPTRRRKTVTKTPHTFELEADLNPVKPKEQLPPAATVPAELPNPDTPAAVVPKKKKRISQAPPPDVSNPTPPPITVSAVPSVQPTSPPPTTPKSTTTAAPVPTSSPASPKPATTAAPLQTSSPVSPKLPPSTSTLTPTNPFTTHRTKKSLSTSSAPQLLSSNPCRFTPPPLPQEAFHGKVIVLTHGASQTGQALVRSFHAAGCRVIFGDANPDRARKFISSLGPPHVVHFNKCDMTRYPDILELFKLATTMYGRVDHAIFGIGEDGGHACTVGEGEKGWFEDRPGVNKTSRMAYAEVEYEPSGLGDILTASVRFARIALAYLKYSPKTKSTKKSIVNPYSTPQPHTPSALGKDDRSLTFLTSISAFKETPLLPIYQIAQHSILGLVRSLHTSVDPDPERDGVRVNAVVTNVMVPRAVAQSGGRMSVQLPPDRPEDVARVVVGVVATNSSTPDIDTGGSGTGSRTGISNGGGIWYEKGHERGMREKYLHGRVIYSIGSECWDVQEGLDRSEAVWMGQRPAEALAKGMSGLNLASGNGGSSWILDQS